ncbi:hypothetical protein J6590_012790 [Homalodisca vitripennis]|nr:hypothetical protein J6590_012790 [Homalodisca vitripennis]
MTMKMTKQRGNFKWPVWGGTNCTQKSRPIFQFHSLTSVNYNAIGTLARTQFCSLGVSDVETMQGVCFERLRTSSLTHGTHGSLHTNMSPYSGVMSATGSDSRRCTKSEVN